ncbi:MAG: ankyrin repeat domain-containing protein [Bacteroidetes bacterium]|jgi:ankyrin repeat protein|nr:ankyrin repeat domain-containing protein [Bacteroidota bacterium]
MKKILYTAIFLCSLLFNAQKNTLLNADFWKGKPSVETIKTEIEKGNSPSEFNNNAFDPVAIAINNGSNLETVKFLVEQKGNSVDKLTHDGRLYLHWAAMTGNAEVIEYLIKKGSKIDQLDTKGLTPLAFAATSGVNNPKVYELFFNAGISPKAKYKNGANILLLSIGNDKDGTLQKLFEAKGLKITDKDDKGNTAFDYAATYGNIDFLKSLQAKGIKATGTALINAAQGTRRSSNGINVFQYLIDEVKINPTSTSEDGATALQLIARKPKQLEIINYLLGKGVDANKTDAEGNNALMVAAGGNDIDNVKILAENTKNINAQNKNGESALSHAIKSGNPMIVETLISKKADINVLDSKGNNLGFYLVQSYKPTKAGEKSDFDTKLNLLNQAGFDVSTPQKDGSTLLHLAVAKNDLGLLKKLEPLKININAVDKEKMTALHKAALIAKDDSILKYLVTLGANKSLKTEFDETAYDLAMENESLKKNNTDLQFLK